VLDGTAKTPFSSLGRSEDWEVMLQSTSDRVWSHFPYYSIPMYKVVSKDIGFRLPFSNFQREVFRWTKLSLPQIHLNSYAIMRAFELVCQYLEIASSKNVFFTLFTVQRGLVRGGGSGWVSFRQKEKMFNISVGKVRSFKEHYFLVRAKSEDALNNLLRAVEEPLAAGNEALARVFYFPLGWSGDHYNFKPSDYSRTFARLSDDEKVAHDNLWAYVKSFAPAKSLGVDGKEVTATRYVDTHGLMLATDPMNLLGSLFFSFHHIFFFCSSFIMMFLTYFRALCSQEI